MATIINEEESSKKPITRPKRICFSFAAHANNLLNRLKSSNVTIDEGLSDKECSDLESSLNFSFPPDLREILQQGLPISQGFPNWRSSSLQQLQILLNLPASAILRRVSKTRFWHPSWGPEPTQTNPIQTVKKLLSHAPILVPIYRHCYIPAWPNEAGNPVFYVDHYGDVRVVSYDVTGFFRAAGYVTEGEEEVWAAKSEKRVRFWSEVAEGRLWWWWGKGKGKVGECMEGVLWKLREGGWKEQEIRKMIEEEDEDKFEKVKNGFKDKEDVTWHLRSLSMVLLRAGWTREDVVYSMGVSADEEKSGLEFHHQQFTVNNINGH